MVLSVLLTKYTSCIAAIVASMHIAVTLYNGSIKVSDNGKMNKANPVTLFNVLCMDNSSFLRTKTNAKLNILINAIILIHTHNHTGICIIGSIFIEQTSTNTKSANVSSLAPNLLSDPVFLATVPSIISVKTTPKKEE